MIIYEVTVDIEKALQKKYLYKYAKKNISFGNMLNVVYENYWDEG